MELLDQRRSLARLTEVGIPTPDSRRVTDIEGAMSAAEELRCPRVVLKAGGLVHKSDAGGVIVGLADPIAVGAAAEALVARLGANAMPLLLQEQVEGPEFLVGLRRSPTLGAVVVVGAGGVLAEILDDVERAVVPVDARTARAMLDRLRARPLLDGFRGDVARDIEALVATVVAVSELATRHADIVEMDLNPVKVGPVGQGVRAVDVRILIDPEQDAPPVQVARDLSSLLRPDSVAVVGVSDDVTKVGARLFRHLLHHGYPGALHPVHPVGGTIEGHPRFTSLRELPTAPDLVCVAVPAQHIPDIAREAVEIGAGAVLVHSSDFAEIGDRGRALQVEVGGILRSAGIPLAGPNDMGIVAPHQPLAASISGALDHVELLAGHVALVSSSGALASCLATRLLDHGVGLSHWIHAGNEADVTIAEYLGWLVDDPHTHAVGLLLEDIKNGPAFMAATRALVAAGKPVFAYHMVRTGQGSEAARSHTGAMVSAFELRESVLRAGGVVTTSLLQTLEDALRLVARHGTPRGRRLAALTFSGGACTIIADAAVDLGFELPALDASTTRIIDGLVPAYVTVRNPLDVSYQLIASPDRFRAVLAAVAGADDFDAVLVQFTTNADPGAARLAAAAVSVIEEADRPVVVSRYGGQQLAPVAMARYRAAGIPVLDAPDRAMHAIGALAKANDHRVWLAGSPRDTTR